MEPTRKGKKRPRESGASGEEKSPASPSRVSSGKRKADGPIRSRPRTNGTAYARSSSFETKYEKGKLLGRGGYGQVHLCKRKQDLKEFAVKIINKQKLGESHFRLVEQEIKILTRINTKTNPHCVQLFDFFQTDTEYYLVMEYLAGGELFDRITKGTFSEAKASEVIKAVAQGLEYLHGQGIVHRDLKPENLVYATEGDQPDIKIIDFGMAKLKPKHVKMRTENIGTPKYLAPEVLKGQEYTEAVDVWSLGVILYILLGGYEPFYSNTQNPSEIERKIKAGRYAFDERYWSNISASAKGLIDSMLTVDPDERITIKQVLAHSWVAGETASTRKFDTNYLRRFQALKRLRKGVYATIAVNKFSRARLSKSTDKEQCT